MTLYTLNNALLLYFIISGENMQILIFENGGVAMIVEALQTLQDREVVMNFCELLLLIAKGSFCLFR